MRTTAIKWNHNSAIISQWVEMRRNNAALDSPFFHPQFTSIVARACSNVEVAVVEQCNKVVGLLPFQRISKHTGVPVGRPLSDYHGLISASECNVDVADLVRQCGLVGWDFDHLIASQSCFAAFHEATGPSPQIDLSGDFDEYLKTHKEVKSLRAKMRKLARDFGSLRMVPVSGNSAAMQQLLRWKSQQYRATGQRDIFKREWIAAVVQEVYDHHDPDFGGILSALYAGDRLVAALFGMRSAGVYHYWFPSYDPAMAHYSPGSMLLLMFVEQAKSIGIKTIDLGKSMSEQKRRFMNASTLVAEGAVNLSSWRRLRRSLRSDLRSFAIRLHVDEPARFLLRTLLLSDNRDD